MLKHHFKALLVGAFLFLGTPPVFSQQAFEGTATFSYPGWGNYAPVTYFSVTEMTYEQLCAFAPEFYQGPSSGTPPHTTTTNYFTVAAGDEGWLGTGTTYTDTAGQCFFDGTYIQTSCNADECHDVQQARGNQSIAYIVYEYTVPPPDPCLDNFTEQCCIEQAANACLNLGGVASYSFLDDTMVGGPSCEYICVGDIEPEDPLPEPPLYTDLSLIEQYLYYILANQWPTTNAIVEAINTIEGQDYSDYLDDILDVLDSIAVESGVDTSELEFLLDSLLTGQLTYNDFLDGVAQITDAIESIDIDLGEIEVGDIAVDTANLEALVQQTNSILIDLLSDDGVPFDDIDQYNWDVPVDGVTPDGLITDLASYEAFLDSLTQTFGIDTEPDIDSLQLDEVYIDEFIDSYQFSLPDVSCPGPRSISLMNQDFTFEWDPMCDLFGVMGNLIIILAYILVPFIVFGVSMRIRG